MRWRTLFRADGLARLTPADLGRLGELGLRTVIDLRTADEVGKGRIDPEHPELAYHHLPMMDVLPPAEELPRWADPQFVAGQYQDMLRSGAAAITRALELLADAGSYPLTYHCMAGKDRTGVLSALVLELLGVAEEEIVGDYALSGEAMQRMLAWLRVAEPERSKEYEAGAAAMVAAEPASMAAFLGDVSRRARQPSRPTWPRSGWTASASGSAGSSSSRRPERRPFPRRRRPRADFRNERAGFA